MMLHIVNLLLSYLWYSLVDVSMCVVHDLCFYCVFTLSLSLHMLGIELVAYC